MPARNGVAGAPRLTIFTVPGPLCRGSIVPFRPGGAERSGFGTASTLDVMEAHHDLRKFITELPVAQQVSCFHRVVKSTALSAHTV